MKKKPDTQIRLEDIKKGTVFNLDENYFEALAGEIQMKVIEQRRSGFIYSFISNPVLKYGVSFFLLLAIAVVFMLSRKENNQEDELSFAVFSDDELEEYLFANYTEAEQIDYIISDSLLEVGISEVGSEEDYLMYELEAEGIEDELIQL